MRNFTMIYCSISKMKKRNKLQPKHLYNPILTINWNASSALLAKEQRTNWRNIDFQGLGRAEELSRQKSGGRESMTCQVQSDQTSCLTRGGRIATSVSPLGHHRRDFFIPAMATKGTTWSSHINVCKSQGHVKNGLLL